MGSRIFTKNTENSNTMKRYMLSALSSSFSRHRNDEFKLRWLVNTQKHHRGFMSKPVDFTSNRHGEENDDVEIQVISREHIKPSSPTPQNLRYYKLSVFDQMQNPTHNPFTFFYRNRDKTNVVVDDVIRDRSTLLKHSLSETLTRFYPFAGKLSSEFEIECNDEGAYFVQTRVNRRLDDVLKNPENKVLQGLSPVLPNQQMSGCYISMVQVNFFSCGGCAISLQHNHKLVDGRSYVTFLKAWAAVARNDATSQIHPEFVSCSLFPQYTELSCSPYFPIWYYTISPAILKHGRCATRRFVFDASALRELKAKASKHPRHPVSRVVAVMALVWKCVNIETQRAVPKPKKTTSVLHVPVDIRSRCSPPLSKYSVGNVILGTHARCDIGPKITVNDLGLACVASKIKNAIEDVKTESIDRLRGENGHVRYVESLSKAMETFCDYKTEYYLTTSMCDPGTNYSEEADFGWGKPVWSCSGSLYVDASIFVNRMVMMDSCSAGGGIEVWLTLDEHVMDALTSNQQLLSFAAVDPTVL